MIATCAPLLRPRLLRGHRTVGRRQLPFLNSEALFRAFRGGRGSGKTYAGALAAWREAGRRQCTGTIVAPTYTMLADDVVPVLKAVAGQTLVDFSDSEMHGTFWNGSEVFLRSAPDSLHVNRLRGPSRSWLWVEEAAYIPEGEECWQISLATLRESGRMGRAWLTTTPRGKGWIYRIFVTDADDNYALFSAHTDENEFTSAQYKAILRASYGVGWFAKQELAGEFCDPEGTLFQRPWFQIVDKAPEFARTYRGWDLAVSTAAAADYTAGVKIGITADQDIYVLDCVLGKWEWPDGRRVVIQTALADGPGTTLCVESVAFQLGAVQELWREPALAQHTTQPIKVERDKLSHALPVASKAQAGKVYLLRGAWNSAFLDEVCAFTGDGKGHDDQVDGMTLAYRGASKPPFRIFT